MLKIRRQKHFSSLYGPPAVHSNVANDSAALSRASHDLGFLLLFYTNIPFCLQKGRTVTLL